MREARLPLREAPAEGEVRLVDVGKHRIGLFRVDGALHALANRCPHRGAPLCEGRVATPIELHVDGPALGLQASVVRCPWHKWEFEIATGRCLVDEKLRVRRYAVRTEGDEIVVALELLRRPRPPRLDDRGRNSSRLTRLDTAIAAKTWSVIEPSGRNPWQPVANRTAATTAQTGEDRCRRLRAVPDRSPW